MNSNILLVLTLEQYSPEIFTVPYLKVLFTNKFLQFNTDEYLKKTNVFHSGATKMLCILFKSAEVGTKGTLIHLIFLYVRIRKAIPQHQLK